jgi:hypothetical protein
MISVTITSPLTCETEDFPEVKIHELCTCTTSLFDQVNMMLITDFIPNFDTIIETKEETYEDLFDNYFKYHFVKNCEIMYPYVDPLTLNKTNSFMYSELNNHKLDNREIKKSKPITQKILSDKKDKVKIINKKVKEYHLVNGYWKFYYPKKC